MSSTLAAGLAALGITLPDAAQRQMLAFRDLLLKWNRTYNLTALRDPEQAIALHLLDSLAILPHVGPGPLLDVGSGGGLPGLPLAIARRERNRAHAAWLRLKRFRWISSSEMAAGVTPWMREA